ncbi:MAG TPA: phosphatase PAP2 family protein [Chloroflexia bacterium]|nr:phosphatase PAP2 family protein [Chloroflexia bacterium]
MQEVSATDSAAGVANQADAQVEAQTHRRALFRGRAILGVGFILLAVFALLTIIVASLKPESFDLPVTQEVQKLSAFPLLNNLLEDVSLPGFSPWAYMFPLAIVVAWAAARRFAEALFVAVAAAATGFADVAKVLVQRARPTEPLVHVVQNYHLDGSSFPSSHVVEYTLVFGFCFYLLFTLLHRGALRTTLLVACGLMVALVGPSRIAMGQHWASDVLGGYALGLGLLLVVIWIYRGVEVRLARRQAALSQQHTA